MRRPSRIERQQLRGFERLAFAFRLPSSACCGRNIFPHPRSRSARRSARLRASTSRSSTPKRGASISLSGPDGLHSITRRLAFGDEAQFVRRIGKCSFALTHEIERNLRQVPDSIEMYNRPGKMVSAYDYHGKTVTLFAFESETVPREVDAQNALVRDAFSGAGWRPPELVSALLASRDVYFDTLAQVHSQHGRAGGSCS